MMDRQTTDRRSRVTVRSSKVGRTAYGRFWSFLTAEGQGRCKNKLGTRKGSDLERGMDPCAFRQKN